MCARSSARAIDGRGASGRREVRWSGMKRLVWLLALAGCPAETPFVVTDVHVAGRPVADALVGVYCAGTPRRDVLGATGGAAIRTDDNGRARIRLPYGMLARECTVTVAKPGLPTIEARGANACSSPVTCPALAIDLAGAIAPPIDTEPRRGIDIAPPNDDEPIDSSRPPGNFARPPRDFARPSSPTSDSTRRAWPAIDIAPTRSDGPLPVAPHAEVAR
jgi:hypothetical protein